MEDLINKINWKAVGAVLIPFIGSSVGSYITNKNIKSGWYESLKFPSWRPPKWVFGPVWTSLYAGMGYASYLVYRDQPANATVPLALYGTQLALNWAWTPIFFGAHKLRYAFYEIIALWGAIGATMVSFFGINPMAGGLFVPYFAWVSFAAALNYKISSLNPEDEGKKN